MFDDTLRNTAHGVTPWRFRAGLIKIRTSIKPGNPTLWQGLTVRSDRNYYTLATPEFCAKYFSDGVEVSALNLAPMLVYNDEDTMQLDFIRMLTSEPIAPPLHFIPSTPSFVRICAKGFGWGMIPQHLAQPYLNTGELVEIAAEIHVDVKLHWHRWQITSSSLSLLTNSVGSAAKKHLHP